MAMSLLLWPLRKAAVIPAALLSATAIGAAFGTFDLSRRSVSTLIPRHGIRAGTDSVSAAAAALSAGTVLAVREMLFAPRAVAPPHLPLEGVPMRTRLSNATQLFMVRVGCVYCMVCWENSCCAASAPRLTLNLAALCATLSAPLSFLGRVFRGWIRGCGLPVSGLVLESRCAPPDFSACFWRSGAYS